MDIISVFETDGGSSILSGPANYIKIMNDILFASVDLPILNKEKATDEIIGIDKQFWWWDQYRATLMLPLMTKGGKTGNSGLNNRSRNDPFEWVSYAPPTLKDWLDTVVFPWMGMRTRVTALLTQPRALNEEHIDCDPTDMGTNQNKFRIVLKGKTDTLYFITETGNVYAPSVDGCFIMDGSWPHGMNNFTDEPKLTIALGAPWNGEEQYDNVDILLNRSHYKLPENFIKYFDIRLKKNS
jgi:hypothetical protein